MQDQNTPPESASENQSGQTPTPPEAPESPSPSNIDDGFLEWKQEMYANMPDWLVDLFFAGSSYTDMMARNFLQTFLVALAGWSLATYMEHRHNKKMSAREAELQDVIITTAKRAGPEMTQAMMVTGSVVVCHDFFRTLFIKLRQIIGGNIVHYERLLVRGRREAFIRMQEEAKLRGFNKIINVRFGSSHIAGRFLPAIELTAYGTGVRE
ncbi:YbjQ family protein [Kordiimonas sp. SCSIO 12610]|uniref:YbjQ family protein n=1 Tax=Kordiimonas sp. SCSIO 12610 TaxID=2829597 RepID=UPI00210BFD56|nr:heavy metal-binding domain-containing protein [Kordiimonas sp. SCSIO 12610]UTW56248.1 heavy metal-binding domain-containing protein [Kordiimonas sp. SCSIO 12610]